MMSVIFGIEGADCAAPTGQTHFRPFVPRALPPPRALPSATMCEPFGLNRNRMDVRRHDGKSVSFFPLHTDSMKTQVSIS